MKLSSVKELEYDLAPHSVMLDALLYKSIEDKVVHLKCLKNLFFYTWSSEIFVIFFNWKSS